MATQEKLYTTEAFEAYIALPENSEYDFELIDGEIVQKVPTQEHGAIGTVFAANLYLYLKSNPIGRVYVEASYRLPQDTRNWRQPDLSYVSDRNRPVTTRGSAPYMPDLAIEIQSPNDSVRKMREKADYYLQNGAQQVWLAYPDKQVIDVYTMDDVLILTINDTLTGGDLLPGFALSVRDIFEVQTR